jgi:hypothetical protein
VETVDATPVPSIALPPVQTAMIVSPQPAPASSTVALPSVPIQTAIVAPSPPPPPAQIVAAQPSITAPAGALIGPPAPTGVVTPALPLPAPVQVVATQPVPVSSGLGSIIATIETEAETAMALPTAAELRTIRLAAQRKAAAAAKAADKLEADALAEKERLAAEKAKRDAEKAEAAKNPARIWVQVAGGANKTGLPSTFKRMREANAELFKGLVAWSTPLNRTNRLLVGPFKSMSSARDLVNKMGKAGLSVFAYTSAVGQEIEKLGVR